MWWKADNNTNKHNENNKKNEPKINGITHAEQSSAQCDRIKSEHANLPHVLAHKIRVSKQYTLLCQNKPEFLVSQL